MWLRIQEVKVKSFSRIRFFLQGISRRISRESSQPRDWTRVSRIAGRHFTLGATKEKHKASLFRLGNPGHCLVSKAQRKPPHHREASKSGSDSSRMKYRPALNLSFSGSHLYSLTNQVCSTSFTYKLWLGSSVTSLRPWVPWSSLCLWSVVFCDQHLAPGCNTSCHFHSSHSCHGDHLWFFVGTNC